MWQQLVFYSLYYSTKWTWNGVLWIIGHKSTEEQLREEVRQLRQEVAEIREKRADSFVMIHAEDYVAAPSKSVGGTGDTPPINASSSSSEMGGGGN